MKIVQTSPHDVASENRIVVLDSYWVQDLSSLYLSLSALLAFPAYFTPNLDSFDECMSDLSWLDVKAIHIHFSNTSHFLEKESVAMLQNVLSVVASAEQEVFDISGIELHITFEYSQKISLMFLEKQL